MIAPAGVFVVDAKHYEGRIEIRDHGWFLRPDERLHVGRRDCSALADKMGWQVAAVESALHAAGRGTPVADHARALLRRRRLATDLPTRRVPRRPPGGHPVLRKRLVADLLVDAAIGQLTPQILAAALPAK